jgi:putative peptidoglycan lipid II flippase
MDRDPQANEEGLAVETAPEGGTAPAKPACAGWDENRANGDGEPSQGGLVAQPSGVASTASPSSRRRLVAAATFIMIGNLLSSLLGMVRLQVISGLFGQGAETDAFFAALKIPQQFFDLLVGGAISGALIPTFVDYGAPDKRRELWRVFSTILNLVAIVTAAVTAILILLAPAYLPLLVQYQGASFILTLNLTRLILPSLLILGLFAVGTALLYALRSVIFASWANGLYHVGIILGAAVGVILLGQHYGIYGAAVGVLIGALGEVALIGVGLARQGIRYRAVLDLKHPAVRQIMRLYAPVALGLIITVLGQWVDLHLATGTGESNLSALTSASALIGFPNGLVAAALSFAILPTLTAHATEGNTEEFKRTLRLGIKLGLLLMIPAMVGLDVLRLPIVAIILRHGAFTLADVERTGLALLNYSYQLPFLVLDQLLIAAFYARKNTLTPVIIGAAGWGFYLLVALPFVGSIGMPALAFAQSFQISMHALILLFLLRRALGPLAGEGLLAALGKICLASAIMGGVCWLLLHLVSPLALFSLQHVAGQLLTVLITAGSGTLVYFALIHFFGLEEVRLLSGLVRRRLGR